MSHEPAGGESAVSAGDRREPPYRILPVIARVVLIVVGFLPWIVPFARGYLPLEVGEALDRLFWPVCHRFPDRTIELAGWLMPLCSRCAGIFAGIAVGAVIAWPRLSLRA